MLLFPTRKSSLLRNNQVDFPSAGGQRSHQPPPPHLPAASCSSHLLEIRTADSLIITARMSAVGEEQEKQELEEEKREVK